ncbi:hypothetical protein UPYG_G00290860 [Umbra pygmaea]|uniref:Sickle tail protein homolog n=1 Tax=Umbra pygmaea TaxID=75934 RepID=A0ABD0W4S2_UMBPY
MTSKSSRLGRPSSAGSKQPSQRKECPTGNRSCMLRVGERLMRAGSEGNLHVGRHNPAHHKPLDEGRQQSGSTTAKESGNNNPRLSSPEDLEHIRRQQNLLDQKQHSEPRSPSTVPRRYTIGGQAPRSSRDPLAMQHAEVERKKEVFLEHLKKRYPHHAAIIMGHQDRIRDHIRGAQHSASPQTVVGEQLEHLSVASLESLETMSEGDGPAAFTRGCRARASLPVGRSASQTRDRSHGVLYLQYAEETKQVWMPDEISSGETVRALFVSAFPQQLTMKMLASPSVAVYVKDDTRNVYYELTDVRNITPHCCLKVYHKDPEHAFNRSNARPNNGDGRIPREKLYGSHSPVHTLQSSRSPVHVVQRAMSPPTVRSMPSSPSRIPYGSRVAGGGPGSTTLPRAGVSSGPAGRSAAPCPSAILERRDVRPDEDLGSKSATVVRADGMYVNVADPYAVQEGRLSFASSQGGSQMGDRVELVGGAVHRAGTKSTASYPESGEQLHALNRQKSRRYGESQGLPPLGIKSPPPSPHRVNEGRMIDSPVVMERGGSIRRSLRRESNGNTVEVVNRTRCSVSSVSSSPVFVEPPSGHHGDRLFQGQVSPNDPQTSKRMKAMEQQISSLAGLVRHALAIGPAEVDGGRTGSPFHVNTGTAPAAGSPAHPAGRSSVSQAPPPDPGLQVTLTAVRSNVADLRQQLHQLRQLQMQNQESVMAMLRTAERELAGVMTESLLRQRQEAEPSRNQRDMVDEDRHKYLTMEDRVLAQLRELEEYVDRLRRDTASSEPGQLPVTLRDVEDGAVNLRRVGEALAGLKGEFPSLQGKMRTVLRVEVEAVRFLKEEPQKMDSMLKRVKALTEALGALRRCVTESHPHTAESGAVIAARDEAGVKAACIQPDAPPKDLPTVESPKPQPRSSVRAPVTQPQGPNSASPVVAHRVKSSPVNMQPHHPSPPLTPTYGRESPTVAKVSPRSRDTSPALQRNGGPWCGDGASSSESTTRPPGSDGSMKTRVLDMEAAERMSSFEEHLQRSAQPAASETEQVLQKAQANLMRATPDLEVTEAERLGSKFPAPDQPSLPDPQVPLNAPLPDEVDALPTTEAAFSEPSQPGNVSAEVTTQASPEPGHKTVVEKPRRSSVEREIKNSSEISGRSSPPPPPRRMFPFPAGPGLTTGRSGEVIFTTRTEVAAVKDAEKVFPQPSPKPSRQPPEVKPKPQTKHVIKAELENKEDEDEEDDDDDDTFMKELQVFQKYTHKDVGKKYVIDLTSAASQVRQIESEFSLSPNEPKSPHHQDKSDENRLDTDTETTRVMYYVTGQKSKERPPSGRTNQSEETLSPSQVANINNLDFTQSELQNADESHLVTLESVIQDDSQSQKVVLRSSRSRAPICVREDGGLSPDLPDRVCPPPPENIGFMMITSNGMQALSTKEYQDIVSSSNGTEVQTIKVGKDYSGFTQLEHFGSDRDPVIIIFDEPMDIQSAYKRMSTIFECEEELDCMLHPESVNEDKEEAESENVSLVKLDAAQRQPNKKETTASIHSQTAAVIEDEQGASDGTPQDCSKTESSEQPSTTEPSNGSKSETKKKFKFKFPKNKLAAISQAIRAGTRTGKKTLEVCEEEEGRGVEDAHIQESQKCDISSVNKPKTDNVKVRTAKSITSPKTLNRSNSKRRTEEICKNAYESVNKLEETIKKLEVTMDNISLNESERDTCKEASSTVKPKPEREGSPSKRPAPLPVSKSLKPPQSKKPKPQVPQTHKPSTTSSSKKQNSSGSSSRMSLSTSSKSRQLPAGSGEKAGGKAQKLQDIQRQQLQQNF